MFIREIRRKISFFFRGIRNAYLRIMGIQIGQDVFVSYSAWLDVQDGKIVLEDGVRVTNGAKVLAHDSSAWMMRDGEGVTRVTTIRKGAFIGMNAVVLPGVTIGQFAIVGAGCVVSKDVPDGAVLVGAVPRIVRQKCFETGKYEKV